MTEEERAKKVAEALRAVWSSLDSHLDWANKAGMVGADNGEFHKECVLHYIKLMSVIGELY